MKNIIGAFLIIIFLLVQAYFVVPILCTHFLEPLLDKFIEQEIAKQVNQEAHDKLMDERWLY